MHSANLLLRFGSYFYAGLSSLPEHIDCIFSNGNSDEISGEGREGSVDYETASKSMSVTDGMALVGGNGLECFAD